jgi:phosphatidylserine synthase 2
MRPRSPAKNKHTNYKDNQSSVGLQTVSNDRTYVSPNILAFHKLEDQEFHPIFYKPKTIITLGLLLLALNILSRSDILLDLVGALTQTASSKKAAMLGMVFAFMCFAAIHYPNTLMVRPHPIFWRVWLGLFSLYAMGCTYLFFLPVDEVRETLTFFDPALGVPLPERSYAEDCRLYTPENPDSKFANL